MFRHLACLTIALTLCGATAAQEVLKKEPPPGALKEGQKVLVESKACPAGQVREVAGAPRIQKGLKRSYRCVPRP